MQGDGEPSAGAEGTMPCSNPPSSTCQQASDLAGTGTSTQQDPAATTARPFPAHFPLGLLSQLALDKALLSQAYAKVSNMRLVLT
jgi:hypothetical protein